MTTPESRYPVPGPLNGVRVIAFEHAWAAPYGTMMLADMGADVVKVEAPGMGDHVRGWTRNDLDGLSPHFLSVNRNKRSIVLDLKNPEGLATAKSLILASDVVISNFAPGTMESLGLGYTELSQNQPGLIYCGVSGFGNSGPYRNRRAYDLLIQAESGLMSVTGTDKDHLAKVGSPVVDIMAAMVASFSVVAALHGRDHTGDGRDIDISMMDVASSVMAFHAFSYALSGEIPVPMGSAHPLLAPYEVYATRTGPVAIAILTEAHWATFCKILERDDLRDRPEFALAPLRVGNRDQLNDELRPVLASWDQRDLVETMSAAGLACAQVSNVTDILDHPQLRARNFYSDWTIKGHHMRAPGAPWRAQGDDDAIIHDQLPAETPGMHAANVLSDWIALGETGIQDLREKGALG